ncbi:DNA-directed RNA polymerase subunit D [Candidatus Woesearchaeota archaeon]|nr:DNA-directed RNA polymerase subunit D [Candidatus Woesearchaeota archaeon]
MDIKLINKQDNKLIFLIKGTDPVFVNTLRRIMISEVPTLAIKKVTFTKNTSAVYDEFIAHRLGLLPLTTDLKSYELQESCSCKGNGCAKCQVSATLKAEGPITVYASDLKFQDPKVKSVYDKIPIIKLLKGQELEFEAVAGLGKAKDHAKFSPCLAFYRGVPEFDITKKTKLKDCIKACNDLLREKGTSLEVTDYTKWNESYEQTCEEHEIKVTNSEKDFIVTIESWGKLNPEEIFLTSLDVLDQKMDEFYTQLSKA